MPAIWNQMPYVYFKKQPFAVGVDKLHGQEVIIRHSVHEQGETDVAYMYGTIRNLEHHAPAFASAIAEVIVDATGMTDFEKHHLTVIEFKEGYETHWVLFSALQHAAFIAASRKYELDMPEFQLPTIHKVGLWNGLIHTFSEEFQYYCLDPHDDAWTSLSMLPPDIYQDKEDGFDRTKNFLVYITPGYDTASWSENSITGQGVTLPHVCFVVRLADMTFFLMDKWKYSFFAYSVMDNAYPNMMPFQSSTFFVPDEQTFEHVVRRTSMNDTVKGNIRKGWDIQGKNYYINDGQHFTVSIQQL